VGKGNRKDEEKKEEEKEKEVSSASLDLSLPEIAGVRMGQETRESASDALSFVFAEDIEDDGSFSEESVLRRGCSPFQLSTLYFN